MSLISLDSIIKISKNIIHKHFYKNRKVENIITNINLDSSSESDNKSDYE